MSTLLGGGGRKTAPVVPDTLIRIQTALNGTAIAIGYGQGRLSCNIIDYVDFVATPVSTGGGKGLLTGGGKGGGKSYTYTAAVDVGICQGPVTSILQLWQDKTLEPSIATLGFTAFLGGYAQSPWSYMTTNHPTHALNYRGLCHAAAGPLQMGSSAQLPNLNWEVKFAINSAISGAPDADPGAVVIDMLTNAYYGVGFPSGMLGALTLYSNYCKAAGMVVSPIYDSQRSCQDMLNELCAGTNSAARWSSGILDIIPYGDTTFSGNGFTYTVPTYPLYAFGMDDFIIPTGGAGGGGLTGATPVQITRARKNDKSNIVKVGYLDRSNAYNTATAEITDDAGVTVFGKRPKDTITHNFFCLASAAMYSASMYLAREQILNTYTFQVGRRFIRLDPMDIVSLTTTDQLALNQVNVRITEITEQSDGSLVIIAEDYLNGSTHPPAYGTEPNAGYVENANVDPGNSNAPTVFEVPVALASVVGLESWLATAGGPNWGGCEVWISSDNVTYTKVGQLNGPSRMGVLTANFPSGSDPDTVNTLSVDLSSSMAQLLSGTQADADQFNTLCYVDGEYVSYQQATLTSTYHYDLGKHGASAGYLRRGAYITPITSHLSGTLFVRLDDSVLKFPYNSNQIGQTIYIKLPAFNIYGAALQSLASVTAYSHVIAGSPLPPAVSNFMAAIQGDAVALSWTDIPSLGIKGYDIYYGPVGGSVATATLLTEASRQTAETTVGIPPGTQVIYIRARDIANQLGPASSVTITVPNTNTLVNLYNFAPDWLGTKTGFLVSYTGLLVPDSTQLASAVTGPQLWEKTALFPVTNPTYQPVTIDEGFISNVRVSVSFTALPMGALTTSPSVAYTADFWSSGADPNTYVPFTFGYVTARYFNSKLVENTSVVDAYISQFTLEIDTPPIIQAATVTVTAPGTTITFASMVPPLGPFHVPPNITVTPADGVGVSGGASAITTTSAYIQEFNGGGTSISGTVSVHLIGN